MFKQNKNLLVVGLIAVVNALGYGIIIPVLYSYATKFGLNDFENGLLFAIFSIFQFIATPFLGRLSDKYGRKPLLVFSIIGTALSFFMMAWAPSSAFLFIARALDGITAGNMPVLAGVIADTTKPEERARGFGIIGGSFSFGFIFGPVIAGLTAGYALNLPFIIAGFISAAAVILTLFLLKESNKHIGEVHHKKLFDFKKLIHALYDKNVGATFLITLFFNFAFGIFIYAFQPFSVKTLSLSANQISFIFMAFGIVGLLVQLFLMPTLSKLLGLKKYLQIAAIIFILSFLAMAYVRNFTLYLLVLLPLALANSSIGPLIHTILSRETDARSQGSIQGLNASYMSIGQILGPLVGGALAIIAISYPFLAAAFLGSICFYLTFHILKPGVRKESAF